MALAESSLPVFRRGDWPGPLTLRRGWARAEARPWNDVVADAVLRLARGGLGFLQACTSQLLELGAPTVLSPPLPAGGRRTWEAAGFVEFTRLALMRLSLDYSLAGPNHLVVSDRPGDLEGLLHIDRAAFPPFWRFDEYGLQEAIDATSRSRIFIIRDPNGAPAGYAVAGYGHAISYLQRVAVHPDWQGQGMGRSLVRYAARSARTEGARAMLLNTQLDNERALGLYEEEGFAHLPDPLAVLRRS